jgi:heat shock protein HtpX
MVTKTIGLSTQIWNNNIRSMALLAFYPFVILAIVWAIGTMIGYITLYSYNGDPLLSDAVKTGNIVVINYWPTIFMIVAIWFLGCYFFHTKMINMLSHGRPVTREEEPALYNLLENLCISRGLKMPKLNIIETDARNAFASGINEKSYAITVTRGLLQSLQEDEIEAVLGHELSHIMNNDVRLLIISVIFTGMIGFTAQLFWNSLRYGRYRGGGKKDMRIMLFIMAIALILWLGYLATLFTRFALSRSREYMADAGSIELTKDPDAMMRALLRISNHDKIKEATDDIALMCIENSKPFLGLFATHPPVKARIKTISEISNLPIPQIENGQIADNSFYKKEEQKNPWTKSS